MRPSTSITSSIGNVSTFFDVDHTLVFSDRHRNARIIDGDRYAVEKYGGPHGRYKAVDPDGREFEMHCPGWRQPCMSWR